MILDKLYPTKNVSFQSAKISEKPLRSLVKSVSWRVIGTLDTVIISWFITGTLELALSIGFVELVSKMILYFCHERMWNKITWGK